MPPAKNYCEHMGYNYTSESVENTSYSRGICQFDENSSCSAEAFLEGNCGQEYVENISCRKEGDPVFTEFETCCGNLEPHVPAGASGQTTCQPEKNILEKTSEHLRFLTSILVEITVG